MSDAIPPAAVPRTDAHILDWLRLIRSYRVGPTTFLRLVRQFGSAAAAVAALPDIAAEAGIKRYSVARRDRAQAELAAGRALGAVPLLFGTADYPAALYDLSDPPIVLWALGRQDLLRRPMVALVGARNASALGKRMAARLAEELGGLGYTVVSGLARGIDAAAHAAALPTGTIAVQAGGIDVIYPKENADLTLKIGESGLRLAEMPPGMQPQARHFPGRNRIIAGLAQGLVVVEGAARSGSLITARAALDHGRDVMAVPGSPLDARAGGCNLLIRDGAVLVRSGEDVHDALTLPRQRTLALADPAAAPAPAPAEGDAPAEPPAPLPEHILTLLSPAPLSEDDVIRTAGAPPMQVIAALAELDMAGRIDRQPGGMVARVT